MSKITGDWPRRRSTSTFNELSAVAWLIYGWSCRDRAMMEDQLDSDRRYHEGQQRMLDNWRNGRRDPIDNKMLDQWRKQTSKESK